ncbi:MAG: hypothetical protein QXT30_05785 [Candidatus Bathyarchaeia archaeon]
MTVKEMLSYLDRFLGDKLLRGPEDIIEVFSGLSGGQIHQLDRALRAFLNYCPIMINVVKDPDGHERFRAVTSLEEITRTPSAGKNMIEIQEAYAVFN